jgi:hypothetical protein
VYALWRAPQLVPALATIESVVPRLRGGADLMWPGVVAMVNVDESAAVSLPWAACTVGNVYVLFCHCHGDDGDDGGNDDDYDYDDDNDDDDEDDDGDDHHDDDWMRDEEVIICSPMDKLNMVDWQSGHRGGPQVTGRCKRSWTRHRHPPCCR